jgi:CubicO group peptidase (beta-lactamase class C family)
MSGIIQGTIDPRFQAVADALSKQLDRAGAGGASVCVYHRGRPVVDVWSGARDGSGAPWTADTLALSFSTTKGVMATLVHRLVERRALRYEDPVAKHWPEFAQAGKSEITVGDVLAHRAGLYAIRSLVDHAERILDWEHMTAALAAARPAPDATGRSGYHAITYGWLVGEIIRRATRRPLDDVLREELTMPLGVGDGAFIGAPITERQRLAELLVPPVGRELSRRARARQAMMAAFVRGVWPFLGLDPSRTKDALLPRGARDVFYSDRVLDAHIPAMNGVFTARALARLYAMLAAGGALDGKRYLSAHTLERATQVQTRRLDVVIGFPMLWRLGYHLVWTNRGILPRAFGHFGFGGSGAWADPDRELAVAMTLNRVAGTPFGDVRMLRIGGIAARCAERA